MRNYFHVSVDGSVEARLGPLYYASYSKIEPVEGDLSYLSQGFTDIYLDLPGIGLFHVGLGSGIGNTNVFEKLDVF